MTNTITDLPVRTSPGHDPHMQTPWGFADHTKTFAEGIVFYATPSHGGFHLDEERNAKIHPALRKRSGWYEEDCEWAKVAFTFPHLFEPPQRDAANRTLRDYFPAAYEKVTKTKLASGQSLKRDQELFEAAHRLDWVVISAINSDQQPGFVECFATIGGVRESRSGKKVEERRFLVPAAEYAQRGHAFVIDIRHHAAYDGPSSFVGWCPKS